METPNRLTTTAIFALVGAAQEAIDFFANLVDEPLETSTDSEDVRKADSVLTGLESAIEFALGIVIDQAKGTTHRSPLWLERLARLPFLSAIDKAHDPGFSTRNLEAWVWQSPENICESRQRGCCDTAAGTYYGTNDESEPMFCPRHYYEMHCGTNAAYHLVDQPAGVKHEGKTR